MKRILVKDLATNALKLRRLPIPPLEKTAERYRASVAPLKAPDTVKAHLRKFDMFISSSGLQMQKELVDADRAAEASGTYPYSYIEPIWDRMYLANRAPLLVNTNAFILTKPIQCGASTQAGMAAAVVHGIACWVRDAVRDGIAPQDPPIDLSLLLRQFGASLVPGEREDELRTTPMEKLRHIIVMHDGHLYEMRVFDDQQVPLERAVIQRAIEFILSITPEADNTTPVSILTAVSRQTWAGAYTELVKTPENAETLRAVREGVIVLCLDTKAWGSDERLANGAMLHGNQEEAENRWYDKHQLIVSADGRVAFNFEHSGSDGVYWTRWIGDVLRGIERSQPTNTTTAAIDAAAVTPLVRPLVVKFGKAFAGHIRNARTEAFQLIGTTAMDHMVLPVGKVQMKRLGVSPDAFVQMCFHIAYHKCRNKLCATYESCTTAKFFHGRTETIRSATQEMLAVAEAINGAKSNEETLAMISAASTQHVRLARDAAEGEGVDRHLTALKEIAIRRNDGAALQFFNDDTYKSCCKWILSTSNVSLPWIDRFGFGPVTPNGYGLGYVIDEESLRITVSAFTSSSSTNVADMKAAIVWAAGKLCGVLGMPRDETRG